MGKAMQGPFRDTVSAEEGCKELVRQINQYHEKE
jgi:hypothetical protein